MRPNLWRRVKEVAGAALDVRPELRPKLLDRLCGSDLELRSAVEQLLEADEKADEAIENAVGAAAFEVQRKPNAPKVGVSPGQRLSHYEVVEEIGHGGMGVVFKAVDTRLDRPVALKFLTPHLVSTDEARKRFVREAKAAGALNHPNVCTIYETDEADGLTFIAMAYVEGEDLARRIALGPLNLEPIVNVALQVGSGLTAAHGKGIVHRDLKPGNIMVSGEHVTLMDFGLAQITADASRITLEGATVGTSAYMSPEQTQGDELDHRTDIWSFGVVLYEMATGQLPFRGHHEQAILYSILNSTPEPVTALRPTLPPQLWQIVKRCLAKKVEERYPNVSELVADLNALKRGSDPSFAVRRPSSGSRETRPSIGVLPLENHSQSEDDYLCDGISEDLTIALGKVERLRVAPHSTASQFRGGRPTSEEIGRKLKVEHLLVGSLRRIGKRVRISVELVAVEDDSQIWSERYDHVMEDLFEIQDAISQAIVESLKVKLEARERAMLAQRYTENLEAYNLCLRGRHYWYKRNPDDFRKAIGFYEQALTADAKYALAHSGLADCYIALWYYGVMPSSDALPRAEAAALRALQIDPRLAAAHVSLAGTESLRWNWDAALGALDRAIEFDPYYPLAHLWRGQFLLSMGRSDEAFWAWNHSAELDPITPIMNVGPGLVLFFQRQYERAVAELEKTLVLDPTFVWTHLILGLAHFKMGNYYEAISSLQVGNLVTHRDGYLGYVYAASGHTERAREMIKELRNGSQPDHLVSYHLAMVHLGLGEIDKALDHLSRSCELGSPQLFWINLLPLKELDENRGDPRFQKILHLMNLTG